MDSYREHPNDFDVPSVSDSSPSEQVGVEIGSDERRMHVRAYNYWVSLLNGRDYPSIEDLEPGEVRDFAENSVLLDFTAGRDNPVDALHRRRDPRGMRTRRRHQVDRATSRAARCCRD